MVIYECSPAEYCGWTALIKSCASFKYEALFIAQLTREPSST